jgi:hypothetical protein
MMSFYEHGNKRTDSINSNEFLDQLSKNWLLKNDYAPWSYE